MAAHPASATHAGAGHDAHDPKAMHLPHGSWWPFWLAFAIFLLGSAILFFGARLRTTIVDVNNEYSGYYFGDLGLAPILALVAALAFLLFVLVGWIREDHRWWFQNIGTGLHMPKAGTLLFISSEIFLFGALFASYFTFKGMSLAHGHGWPDHNPITGEEVHLPLVTTLFFSVFLFASSFTIHKAEKHLLRGEKRQFNTWWLVTIILGLIFLGGQVMEYATLIREGHTLGSSQFITVFYMLTGTHGLHVLGGLFVLVVTYVRSVKGQFDEHRHALPQSAALYWHFVDIVWVVVLLVVYVLNVL